MQSTVGRLWTDSVAYVALITGAAVSIAGNVVDTQRIRGDRMDALDVVLAALFPGLVVLMVEVFVSSRWHGLKWPMQVLRWAGCAGVTFVAMRISWVHLNDLMLTRGQKADVAIMGPLAIDFLAIMATALILAGRVTRVGGVPEVLTVDEVLNRWGADFEPETDWDRAAEEELGAEMLADSQEIAPVSPAAPRRPRSQWDAYTVCGMAVEGVKASVARAEIGIGQSTYGRYLKVARILKENPRAEILPAEKVPAEHVQLLRELCSK